jgi:hypothetical protein
MDKDDIDSTEKYPAEPGTVLPGEDLSKIETDEYVEPRTLYGTSKPYRVIIKAKVSKP